MARAEENHSMDRRQCDQRHTDAREDKIFGPSGLPYFTRQLCAFVTHALFDGRREPLSNVWQIAFCRLRHKPKYARVYGFNRRMAPRSGALASDLRPGTLGVDCVLHSFPDLRSQQAWRL